MKSVRACTTTFAIRTASRSRNKTIANPRKYGLPSVADNGVLLVLVQHCESAVDSAGRLSAINALEKLKYENDMFLKGERHVPQPYGELTCLYLDREIADFVQTIVRKVDRSPLSTTSPQDWDHQA